MNAGFSTQLRSCVTDRILVDLFIDKQLAAQNIRAEFPKALQELTETDFAHDGSVKRRDLRSAPCLTIDCASTQDMDDAIGVEAHGGGYLLRVHIADVSDFVDYGSAVDEEATKRGTSVYFPGRTVPMLPPILTDNLCSLMPGVDRKAITVEAFIDEVGEVVCYGLYKSIINSKVKGVYDEVNAILRGDADNAVLSKYSSTIGQLRLLDELATKLNRKRIQHGAEVGCRAEPSIVFRNDYIDIEYEESGAAESIVEECMVLANSLVASYFAEKGLPSVFRHQQKKGDYAAYASEAWTHASLAVDSYTHFTSPIRRLGDLRMHQILSDYLAGATVEELQEAYLIGLEETCVLATKSQRRAKGVQRAVSKYCLCRYFEKRPYEEFTGRVAGCDCKGRFLVAVEGLGVSVVASRISRIRKGAGFAFRVSVNWDNKTLYAHGMRAVAACS